MDLGFLVLLLVRLKIPDVTERLRRDRVGTTLSSNLVYTIWVVFGGFILHFLLCNYLTVLLRPSYEKPVETAEDLIKRGITPFYVPGGEILRQFFADSPDPNFKEISRRLVIAKDWDEFNEMVKKVTATGMFSQIGNVPAFGVEEKNYTDWYRSTDRLPGLYPYGVHLLNKKWPLKKVFFHSKKTIHNFFFFLEVWS